MTGKTEKSPTHDVQVYRHWCIASMAAFHTGLIMRCSVRLHSVDIQVTSLGAIVHKYRRILTDAEGPLVGVDTQDRLKLRQRIPIYGHNVCKTMLHFLIGQEG